MKPVAVPERRLGEKDCFDVAAALSKAEPCPFCGALGAVFEFPRREFDPDNPFTEERARLHRTFIAVACGSCHASGPLGITALRTTSERYVAAIEAWNRRASGR